VRYRAAPHPEVSVNLIISLSLLCLEVGRCASYLSYVPSQDGKRRAEMLAMRTIFLEWWVAEWVARGGVFEEAVAYPQIPS
jgi:hypothetical protein